MTTQVPDLFDWLAETLDSRPVKVGLALLIVLSVLPYPLVEAYRGVFLVAFGLEFSLRALLIGMGRIRRSRVEFALLAMDLLALMTFLPLRWSGLSQPLLRTLRLLRLLLLLRFARTLADDLFGILTRREQLQQFGLVTLLALTLSFLGAAVLSNLNIPADYTGLGSKSGFWDKMWWAFRQIESPDNLAPNLAAHPVLLLVSLALTIMGIFVFSYLIGLGTNVVDQVVRAGRRRPVGHRRHTLVLGPVHEYELLVREFVNIHNKNRSLRMWSLRDVSNWIGGGPMPSRHALPRMTVLGETEEPPGFLFESDLRWVSYREGHATDPAALDRVAAHEAKRAVFLASDSVRDADAITLANLSAFRRVNTHAHTFVEVRESKNVPLVVAVGGEGTFPLDVSRFMGLFLCHHLLVPGFGRLFRELLSAEGSEFYTHIMVDQSVQTKLASQAPVDFETLASSAYKQHGVSLLGVFAGTPVSKENGQIPVNRLLVWTNPLDVPEEDVAAAGFIEDTIPADKLAGVFGIASSYRRMRDVGRSIRKRDEHEPVEAGAAAELVDSIAVGNLRFDGILVVAASAVLPALVDGLSRFVSDLRVTCVIEDGATAHRDSLVPLGIELSAPLTDQETRKLSQGGTFSVALALQGSLAERAASCAQDSEAVVFLSDPFSEDPDAQITLRALRFVRALPKTRTKRLHILVEFVLETRGEVLAEQMKRCAPSLDFEVTVLSSDRIQNYFMVHSAFVPGVTAIYERLLGSQGQEMVYLPTHCDSDVEVGFASIRKALSPHTTLPIALVDSAGQLRVNPSPSERFALRDIDGIFAVADLNKLSQRFPQG